MNKNMKNVAYKSELLTKRFDSVKYVQACLFEIYFTPR